ncbi:hypothetical protein [Lewinella sp. 4G2]|uniref:alginate O-acetyltransferase AlgX-related protein n=1 Tax=Lewinella sp. 4G2 TaxID=1803372 RepID=UPI0007B4CEC4|nr:hypothetical protein [Lewinella sp. 4G2]OAV45501.1 hypothetical protein A3850_013830 [Lewinella sp. 4G2]
MRVLLILLLVILCLPLLLTGKVGMGLVGHTPVERPVWGAERWFDGTWQASVSNYLREQFGYRNDFVRTNNGKDYFVFGEIHANSVVAGKEGYLFEEEYLQAATGTNAADHATIEKLGKEMAFVRDSLAAHGVDFLVVMAPGKGSYFPEYRPEPYASLPLNAANETSLLSILRQRQIEHLNFNEWFRQMKDTTQYPLFPKQGIHWTEYGQLIAMDSLINYVEQRLDIDMPELAIDSIEVSREQRGTEADIFYGMNLPTEPDGYPLAYPSWHVGNPDKPQPRILFVGDSFFWNQYLHHGVNQKFFGNGDFLYYFNRLMRDGTDQGDMADINLPEVLYEHDMVVLFETENHYQRMGNGFLAATVESYLTPNGAVPKRRVEAMMARIREDEKWFAYIQQSALEKGQEVEAALYENAEFMILEEMRKEALNNQNRK